MRLELPNLVMKAFAGITIKVITIVALPFSRLCLTLETHLRFSDALMQCQQLFCTSTRCDVTQRCELFTLWTFPALNVTGVASFGVLLQAVFAERVQTFHGLW